MCPFLGHPTWVVVVAAGLAAVVVWTDWILCKRAPSVTTWCNRREPITPSAMATVEVKYLTQPHDGTPGTPWDDFEERILGVASGKTDERGWSLADTLNDVDEGGAAGPPMPGGAAAQKAIAARRRRLKDSYSLLYQRPTRRRRNRSPRPQFCERPLCLYTCHVYPIPRLAPLLFTLLE